MGGLYFSLNEGYLSKRLAIRCGEHPDWQLKAAPTSDCDVCYDMWQLVKRGAEITYVKNETGNGDARGLGHEPRKARGPNRSRKSTRLR